MLTCGIVGLPNVGKSTLFNALTKAGALAANYPFATIEPNVGTVTVPDERLDLLCELYKPKRKVPTIFEFTDIAGLVKGASKGEGLGNQFLSHIRETDAICQVVRCFDDPNITHVDGTINPVRDVETINVELIFADLEIIEKRIPKIEKKARLKTDKESQLEYDVLKRLQSALLNDIPARKVDLSKEELKAIKHFSFLTLKPMLYVANVSEDDVHGNCEYVKQLQDLAKKEKAEVIVISVDLEQQMAELDEADRQEFLADYQLESSGIDNLIKGAYRLLGLKTFLTCGPDECRAWTFRDGFTAKQCAGVIHTDFARGFIKAETMSFTDLKSLGSEKAVKEAGLYRLEGKDYLAQDGDIFTFRFNV